jgi:curved DNA-binding protein CbpA
LEQVTFDLPNYYKLLNLGRDATEAQIRTAYRKKVFEFHPDKLQQLNPDSDEKLRERAKTFTQALHRANKIL